MPRDLSQTSGSSPPDTQKNERLTVHDPANTNFRSSISGEPNGFTPEEMVDEDENETVFDNQVLTVKEVAKLLKLSQKTIYKKVRQGEIPHRRIGDTYRFLRSELIGWMKGE